MEDRDFLNLFEDIEDVPGIAWLSSSRRPTERWCKVMYRRLPAQLKISEAIGASLSCL